MRSASAGNAQQRAWDGRSPVSVAAGVIYLIASLPRASKRVSAAAIAQAANIAETTVRLTYRCLVPLVMLLMMHQPHDARHLVLEGPAMQFVQVGPCLVQSSYEHHAAVHVAAWHCGGGIKDHSEVLGALGCF
jgi:transcription initiation factor TFIIIB Brf1 subunit/transcription initiation factor TFIIB